MLKRRAAIYEDLNRLGEKKKQADENLVKLNKCKQKVLHLWQNNPLQQCRLATDGILEDSNRYKNLKVRGEKR